MKGKGDRAVIPNFAKRVSQFVDKFDRSDSNLPLVHISPISKVRLMAKGDSIAPAKCPRMKEEIIYMFYGRPAYRTKESASELLAWNNPIAFIVDKSKARRVRKIFPFDSGAFIDGHYGRVFPEESKVSYFELNPTMDSIGKFITAFYEGSSKNYMAGKSDANHVFSDFDFELQGVQHLATRPGSQFYHAYDESKKVRVDERASALELQIQNELHFPDDISYILVPETIITDDIFQTIMRKWSITDDKIIPYQVVFGAGLAAWTGSMYQKLIEIYKQDKII